jgi:hypothetical protein
MLTNAGWLINGAEGAIQGEKDPNLEFQAGLYELALVFVLGLSIHPRSLGHLRLPPWMQEQPIDWTNQRW